MIAGEKLQLIWAIFQPGALQGRRAAEGLHGFLAAAVLIVIAMTPPVILALLAQRYIVRGLTFGAVKG